MQHYIYSYLFRRTLSDLDELMNVAPDDAKKGCLWDARRSLLLAKGGPLDEDGNRMDWALGDCYLAADVDRAMGTQEQQ